MALRFSGTAGNYLGLSSVPSWSSFSVCGWAKLSTDRNALSTLFVREDQSPFAYIGIGMDTTGTQLKIENDGAYTNLLACSVGDIFFWCMTSAGSGTNTLKGYAAKAGDAALSTAQRNIANNGAGHTYTRLGDNAYSEPYDGFIDNIIVYDSVLTAEEVNAQWRRRLPIKTPYSWLLANETTADYTDKSGNGRNWTLTGSALSVEDGAPVSWGSAIILPYGSAVGVPTLSAPGVNSITQTTAIPKVTLTF